MSSLISEQNNHYLLVIIRQCSKKSPDETKHMGHDNAIISWVKCNRLDYSITNGEVGQMLTNLYPT